MTTYEFIEYLKNIPDEDRKKEIKYVDFYYGAEGWGVTDDDEIFIN